MNNKIAGWLEHLTDLTPTKTLKPSHIKSIKSCVLHCAQNATKGSKLRIASYDLNEKLNALNSELWDQTTQQQIISLFKLATTELSSLDVAILKIDINTANTFNCMLGKYDYLIVTDLEMTCVKERRTDFRSETIEIGCVAVKCDTLEIVDSFSQLVKPIINTTLSDFCVELTSITQVDIDDADKYSLVAPQFSQWLSQFRNSAFVAWGSGDHKQLNLDAILHNIKSPIAEMPIINLKQIFKNFGIVKRGFGLKKALLALGIEQGEAHRALPDAINTSKLLPFMREKALKALGNKLTKRQVESHGKLLTLVLRHMPAKANVSIDDSGWCDLQALSDGLNSSSKHNMSPEIIKEVAFRDDGSRFQLSQEEDKIRCLQGHSLPHVKIDFELVKPTSVIFHGTSEKNMLAIKASSEISKMERNFIHLTSNIDKAVSSGKRYGEPVVLMIDTESMLRDGYAFFLAENGVYLTDVIPLMYVREVKI